MLLIAAISFCISNICLDGNTDEDFCSRLNEDEVCKLITANTAEFTARARVSSTILRYGRVVEATVATWAEFQQIVVELNITFSQVKRSCILQGSDIFQVWWPVGKGVTVLR